MELIKKMNKDHRKTAFKRLIMPIVWSESTTIEDRKDIVYESRRLISIVMPFLKKKEKRKAIQWLKDETHSDLWD